MSIRIITPPVAEPVSLSDIKAFLRVDAPDGDDTLADLIAAARKVVEARISRALVTQTLRLARDAFPPEAEISLERSPVQSIVEVRTFDAGGQGTVYGGENYVLDGAAHPGRLVRVDGASWPVAERAAAGVEVDFVAGYGDAPGDVPADLRQAVRLMIAHLYERREAVTDERPYAMPQSIEALLAPYARVRL